jgi:hypothetical protein
MIEVEDGRARMVAEPKDDRWSSYGRHGLGLADALLDGFPEWKSMTLPGIDRLSIRPAPASLESSRGRQPDLSLSLGHYHRGS